MLNPTTELDYSSIYQQCLKYSDNLFILLSAELKIIDINIVAANSLGWKRSQAIGKSIIALCNKYGIELFITSYPKKVVKKIIQIIHHDKKLRIEWKIIPVDNSVNQLQKHVLLIGKQTADFSQLEFEAMQLNNVIKYTPHLFYWKDRDSVYLGCNDEFAKLAGLNSRYDVVGKSDYDLIWKDRAHLYTKFDKVVIRTKKPQLNIEETIAISGNKTITAISNKVPLFDNNKRVIGVLGITTDITERKEMEKALQLAKEKAEAANIAKTQFLANISHDIRTPLVGIQGIALLLTKALPDELKPEANSIVHASSDLLNLLNEVISLAQLETGKTLQQTIAFNLKSLLSNIITTFEPVAKKKALKINFTYADTLPTVFRGNRMYLNRIILNLISNALKFTKHGHISINVQRDKKIKRDHAQLPIKISVTDTGIGIPKKEQQAIFDSFTRLNPSYEGVYKGSGLGLHITKQFIEQLGGTIEVDSKPDQGSTFTVHVNLEVTNKQTEQEIKDEIDYRNELEHSIVENELDVPQKIQIKQSLGLEEAKVHALLVEDNPMIQKVSTITLNSIGCFVDMAVNGQQALQMASQKTYDIIFMDIGLPDINGSTVSSKIRQQQDSPNFSTPIIALTAHMDSTSKDQCLSAGMNAVITKPLTEQQGHYLLKRYLLGTASKKPMPNTSSHAGNLRTSTEINLDKAEPPIIDLDDGAKIIHKNHSEAISMLDLLAKSLPKEQSELADAFLRQDWISLQHTVHHLYGSTCFCGVPRLRNAAKNLEIAFSKDNHEKIANLYEELMQEILNFLKAYDVLKNQK